MATALAAAVIRDWAADHRRRTFKVTADFTMRKSILFIILFLLVLINVSASRESFPMTQLSHDGQKAYQTLLHAERFEDEAIGYAGELSKLVHAYRILLKEKAADQAFKSLLAKATLAGQLYALCGIYYTDHNLFLTLVDNYKVKNEDVLTLFGCIGGKMLASEIVQVNSPTVVRLSYPDQTINEWIDSHKEIVKNGFLLDIAGGGYPSKFSQKFKPR